MIEEYQEKINFLNTKPLLKLPLRENSFVKYNFSSSLPNFIKLILDDVAVSPTSKDDFYKTFVKYYIKNEGFQEYISGWILLFIDRQFYGIYSTREEAYLNCTIGRSRHIYVVGDLRTSECYSQINAETSYKDKYPNLKSEIFKVKCKISNHPNDNPTNIVYEDTYLFDTGCTGTEFNLRSDWDYENDIFANPNNDPAINQLNSRIFKAEDSNYSTAGGKIVKREIIFSIPIYLKAEDEEYFPIYSLIIEKFSWLQKKGNFFTS